jgi:hypothetical protein
VLEKKNKQTFLVYIPTYIHVKFVLYLFKVLNYKFPKIIFIIFGAVNKATHHHKTNIKQYWFLSLVSSLVDLPDNMWINKKHIEQQIHKTCEKENMQRNKLYFDKVTNKAKAFWQTFGVSSVEEGQKGHSLIFPKKCDISLQIAIIDSCNRIRIQIHVTFYTKHRWQMRAMKAKVTLFSFQFSPIPSLNVHCLFLSLYLQGKDCIWIQWK